MANELPKYSFGQNAEDGDKPGKPRLERRSDSPRSAECSRPVRPVTHSYGYNGLRIGDEFCESSTRQNFPDGTPDCAHSKNYAGKIT